MRRSTDIFYIHSRSRQPSLVQLSLFRISSLLSLSNQQYQASPHTFRLLYSAEADNRRRTGSLISAVILLSFATHLSLHPILLLPPLILLVNQTQIASTSRRSLKNDAVRGVLVFAGHQAMLLGFSRWMTGSWAFLSSVYGVMYVSRSLYTLRSVSADLLRGDSLTIPDLTPNIGLAWYFFIEMFDHFRSFFLVVFALHPLVYVAPLTYFYRYVSPELSTTMRF